MSQLGTFYLRSGGSYPENAVYFDLLLFTHFCRINLLEHLGGTCAHIHVSRHHPNDGAQQAMSTESTQHCVLCTSFTIVCTASTLDFFFRDTPSQVDYSTSSACHIDTSQEFPTCTRAHQTAEIWTKNNFRSWSASPPHPLGSTSLVYIYAECTNLRDTINM